MGSSLKYTIAFLELLALFLVITFFATFQAEGQATPPFRGTVWVTPDILVSSDPTSFDTLTYLGRGMREVYDRRISRWVTVNAYLFDAKFGARTMEFQVNPEFGSVVAARTEVNKFTEAIGRLPKALLSHLREVEVNAGQGLFGGSSHNGSILIHTEDPFTDLAIREGFLEEVLFHEAAHVSLDMPHAESADWMAAQVADGTFISDYARNYPRREDVAETILMYFAVRYMPDRLSSQVHHSIVTTIPHRIDYFVGQQLDMSPYARASLTMSSNIADRIFTVGTAIQPLALPTAQGGVGPYTYTLTPTLPAGLSLDATTRTITGTPTVVTTATTYTYTATDANGASASQQFTIEVHSRIALPGNIANQAFARAQRITPLVLPEATGGASPITYSLTPALPTGLSFNAATRNISGTPMVVTTTTQYAYTATDANGASASQQFNIEVYSPVHAEQASLPESFTVRGNYPNPFRHATRLVFDLPWRARVSVEVMDLMGRRVAATPVSELAAGWGRSIELSTYSATSSGVYVYRVHIASPAGDAVHTGRFVRVR